MVVYATCCAVRMRRIVVLLENIRGRRDQYDQDFAGLCYEDHGLQSRIANYDSRSEAFLESSRVAFHYLEVYGSESLSSHFRLESNLSSALGEFVMVVARFENKNVGVRRTYVVTLISSASSALEFKSSHFVEVLRSFEHSGTASGADPESPARPPNLCSLPFSSFVNVIFCGDLVSLSSFPSHFFHFLSVRPLVRRLAFLTIASPI